MIRRSKRFLEVVSEKEGCGSHVNLQMMEPLSNSCSLHLLGNR
jgi:hypothetical protein